MMNQRLKKMKNEQSLDSEPGDEDEHMASECIVSILTVAFIIDYGWHMLYNGFSIWGVFLQGIWWTG